MSMMKTRHGGRRESNPPPAKMIKIEPKPVVKLEPVKLEPMIKLEPGTLSSSKVLSGNEAGPSKIKSGAKVAKVEVKLEPKVKAESIPGPSGLAKDNVLVPGKPGSAPQSGAANPPPSASMGDADAFSDLSGGEDDEEGYDDYPAWDPRDRGQWGYSPNHDYDDYDDYEGGCSDDSFENQDHSFRFGSLMDHYRSVGMFRSTPSKREQIVSRHNQGKTIPPSDIVFEGNIWKVKSERGHFLVKLITLTCKCKCIRCPVCKLCEHALFCTCGNTKKFLCKHSHAVFINRKAEVIAVSEGKAVNTDAQKTVSNVTCDQKDTLKVCRDKAAALANELSVTIKSSSSKKGLVAVTEHLASALDAYKKAALAN